MSQKNQQPAKRPRSRSTTRKKPAVIGVLGGLGPPTTAKFYLELVEQLTRHGNRPRICIWNVAVNLAAERAFITRGQRREHFAARMIEGARALERAGCARIVIPCNTVHVLHEEVQRAVRVPITNMITVTAHEAKARHWKRVLVLATSTTIAMRLHQIALHRHGIDAVVPTTQEQSKLDQAILALVNRCGSTESTDTIVHLTKKTGIDGIVLGCTDLQLVLSESSFVLDSTHALARSLAADDQGLH